MKRLLLIGLGRWGANHLRVLKSMAVELFVSDLDEKRLDSAEVPQHHRSRDARAIFSQIDAAVIVTPAPSHFEICRELLEAGKDVFVEKPMSLVSSEAKELTKLAEQSGLILQVGHIFRFDPASLWMREAIGQGRFGHLKMLRARFSGFKRPRQDTGVFVEKPMSLVSSEAKELTKLAEQSGLILQVGHIFRFDPASLWMREAIGQGRFGHLKMLRARFSGFKRPRQDTGVTFADSIHFIDLFNFFLGSTPRRIHAVVDDFLGRGMDDESLVVLEYDRGDGSFIRAAIEAGYHAPGKIREVMIVGADSSAVCDYNVAQYKIKLFENRHVADGSSIKASEGAVHQLEFPPEEPLRAELAAFIDSIESRNRPAVDGWAGFEAVREAKPASG